MVVDLWHFPDLPESGVIWNVDNQEKNVRRVLVEQSSNLAAIPPNIVAPTQPGPTDTLPSRSSGSFPANPNRKKLSPAPIPTPTPSQEHKATDTTNPAAGKSGNPLNLIVGLSVGLFSVIVASAIFIICRSRATRTIGPWKTGLSGQLQKAFITGMLFLHDLETF